MTFTCVSLDSPSVTGPKVNGNNPLALVNFERLGTAFLKAHRKPGVTLGADKAYDVTDFVADLRTRGVTPSYRRQRHRVQTGRRPQNRHRRGVPQQQRLRYQPTLPQTHPRTTSAGSRRRRVSRPSRSVANQKWPSP